MASVFFHSQNFKKISQLALTRCYLAVGSGMIMIALQFYYIHIANKSAAVLYGSPRHHAIPRTHFQLSTEIFPMLRIFLLLPRMAD